MTINLQRPSDLGSGPLIRAQWRNIRWKPNESTGELLNIGVAVTDADGRQHVKLIETFERVKCLYDAQVAADAKFLIRVVKDAVMADVALPSNNVYWTEPKFASGNGVEEILRDLFRATVPLGIPRAGDRQIIDVALPVADTSSVRREVLDALRGIAGMGADRIIATEKAFQVMGDGVVHYLDIPLQHTRALGTIVSARYSQLKDNELNLLRADSDLQVARKVYSRDRLYMYVVRNEEERNADKTDDLLKEFIWKFDQVGIEMKTYTQPVLVAHDILEDMPVSN